MQTTSSSLLERVKQGQDQAIRSFYDIYRPLLVGWVKQSGIRSPDAEDLSSDVLSRVTLHMRKLAYQRGKGGGFRGYLHAATRNGIRDYWRSRRRTPPHTRINDDFDAANPDPSAAAWNQEYNRRLLETLLTRVEGEVDPESWKIFILHCRDQVSAKDIAAQFGISDGAVYSRSFRVMEKLRALTVEIDPDLFPEI